MGVSRYFKADTWKQKFSQKNKIVNKRVRSLNYSELLILENLNIGEKNFSSIDFMAFLDEMVPNWKNICPDKYFKKFMEFYISYVLLNPHEADVFLDAAGGIDTYAGNLPCKKKYVQDIAISDHLREEYGSKVECIEGSISSIPLPSDSVDKICCHHSFEHFRGSIDSEFIDEVLRLLAPKGRCCIVPIFLSDDLFEIVNIDRTDLPFDREATKIIDPTSPFTGGKSCGDFARVYSLDDFQNRIIDCIDKSLFKTSLIQFTMEGIEIPDLNLKCHKTVAAINYPYRALLIEKRG